MDALFSTGILNYTWRQVRNVFPKISKWWWSTVRMRASTTSSGKTSSAATWSVSRELVCLCAWRAVSGSNWLSISILFLGEGGGGPKNCCSLFYLNCLLWSGNIPAGGYGYYQLSLPLATRMIEMSFFSSAFTFSLEKDCRLPWRF